MSNNNIGTTVKIVLIVSIFMIALFYSMVDISEKNTILDDKSLVLIDNLNADYNTNDYENSLLITSNNLTNDSSTLGIDPFYRQNAEDKQDITGFTNTLETIYKFPALFLLMFGVENNAILLTFSGLIWGYLVFLLALQGYKALRTGEVDS